MTEASARRTRVRQFVLLATVVSAIGLLAGCTLSRPPPSPCTSTSGGGSFVRLDIQVGTSRGGSMFMSPTNLAAPKCARVQFIVHNEDSVFHDLSIIGYDGEVIEHDAEAGQTVVTHHLGNDYFIANDIGTFIVKCQVGDHAARGMQGTLTVS